MVSIRDLTYGNSKHMLLDTVGFRTLKQEFNLTVLENTLRNKIIMVDAFIGKLF